MRFVERFEPGYTRRRRGKGWQYLTIDGRALRCAHTIARLNAVALPPAYREALYARHTNACLQATGIDALGRKQYRYHPEFRKLREDAKFGKCLEFGLALPRIRKAIDRELSVGGRRKEHVVAAVVRLLDIASLRVGNPVYERAHRSYGATTLRNRHVRVAGDRIWLDYVGKSGIRHRMTLQDARLARVVKRCQDEPGQTLFQYEDHSGVLRPVRSNDVNEWLHAISGTDFSAKHFRTWWASAIAFGVLARARGHTQLKPLLAEVAQQLGNTPAVARKSYIHPALIEAALAPVDRDWRLPRATLWLSREERGLLDFLETVSMGR